MSYATVADADTLLSHSAAWLALERADKERHLMTAALWMNFTYEWRGCLATCPAPVNYTGLPYTLPMTLTPNEALVLTRSEWPRMDCDTGGAVKDCDGCPIDGIPTALKVAQAHAAVVGMTTPLFGSPASPSDGGLTKKLIKAGPVTIERQWSEPTRGSEGQLVLTNIDAILAKIGTRRGTGPGISVLVV